MVSIIRDLWYTFRGFLETFGALQIFLLRLVVHTPATMLRFRLVAGQVYNAGALSLVIIMVCGVFTGMVLALLAVEQFERYGSEDYVGAFTSLALNKQLGPVLTALLFAGRAGTALASEIGLMRATDQLSGMEMMAVDPIKRVVVPRFIGGVISMPLLAAVYTGVGMWGAYIVSTGLFGLDAGTFWSTTQGVVRMEDITEGIIKSCFFGVAASLIAVFEGYNAFPTAEGVSRATTRTVVITAVVVLILNFMLTAIML